MYFPSFSIFIPIRPGGGAKKGGQRPPLAPRAGGDRREAARRAEAGGPGGGAAWRSRPTEQREGDRRKPDRAEGACQTGPARGPGDASKRGGAGPRARAAARDPPGGCRAGRRAAARRDSQGRRPQPRRRRAEGRRPDAADERGPECAAAYRRCPALQRPGDGPGWGPERPRGPRTVPPSKGGLMADPSSTGSSSGRNNRRDIRPPHD